MRSAKKLLYIATYNQNTEPGVHFKVQGFVRAARNNGFNTEIFHRPKKQLKSILAVMFTLIKTNAKYIIVRSLNLSNIYAIPFLIICRLQGKYLCLDVATPRKAAYHEIYEKRRGSFKKITFALMHYLNGPWTMWPYNKVIQYGEEGAYFLFGNRKRTIYLGNGIDLSRMPLRKKNYVWPDKYLNLVGVGNISDYHGFDRIIRALYQWNFADEIKYKVKFTIIGEGDYLEVLKDLVTKLNLEKFVRFEGQRDSDYIIKSYSESHLAVSSLGLFRINLNVSGVLKAREYCLVGIPFIACGKDVDFPTELPFRMIVSNDESIDDILKIFEKFDRVTNTFTDEEIRNYALSNLSFETQFKKIGI